MYGAIIGNIAGSIYEGSPATGFTFQILTPSSFLTSDTVLTLAIADALLNKNPIEKTLKEYGKRYPTNYGFKFMNWLSESGYEPYGSFGNGSAMRVSSVPYFCKSEKDVKILSEKSAAVTHDHDEGKKGAYAVSLAIFLALKGSTKEEIRKKVTEATKYDLTRTVEQIRPHHRFNDTCQGSVPEAICAFLDSNDYESAIRNAIYLGGDADTQACIAGAIAEAYYKEIPLKFQEFAQEKMANFPEFIAIIEKFYKKFNYGVKFS